VWKASKGKMVYAIKSIELSKKDAMRTAEMEESFVNVKFHFLFFLFYFYWLGSNVHLLLTIVMHSGTTSSWIFFFEKIIFFCRSPKGDVLYVVMEYCPRGDLEQLILKSDYRYGPGLEDDRLMTIAIELLLGLQVLHRNKIIHRDIKALNALFDSKGILKICM
jgi:serine/threonine protein kinase